MQQMQLLISDFISSYIQDTFIWLIEEKSSYEPIGYITFDIPYKSLNIGEIAYLVGTAYQRKGYAYEALSAIIEYLFNQQNIYMIEAKYNVLNSASGQLLKKLRFVQDGILRNRRINRSTGERCHLVVCSLTKEEYI